MRGLPPPQTFAEGMRLLFALAALIAGIAFGLGTIAVVSVLVWGGWPATHYGKIISILGAVAIGALILVAITQIGILLGGPVGRFKVSASKEGASIEGDSTGTPPAVVEQAAKGAAAGAVSAATEGAKP